jgi:predicted DNA-binding transcriptional regulator AlpA
MSELMDTAQIAEVLNLPREYVTDRVVKRKDFPKPSLALSRKTRRWDRDAVHAWLRKQIKAAQQ